MNEIFVDSGILIHLFDCLDKSSTGYTHKGIKKYYDKLLSEGNKFISTNFVISETFNRITNLVNKDRVYASDDVLAFHETIKKNVSISTLDNSIIIESLHIWEQNKDYKYSFIDASIFAFLEKYGFIPIFTIDFNITLYHYKKGYKIERVPFIDIFNCPKW